MESINTVTISIDEYFELRNKAQMNDFLLERLGFIDGRHLELERRLGELEWMIKEKLK